MTQRGRIKAGRHTKRAAADQDESLRPRTGAVLGGFLGALWIHLWPGTPVGAFALVGAAAMVGAVMQAPLVGLVLVLELTHGGFNIIIPIMAATIIATLLVRQIDGYSIYSARLPGREASSST